MAIYAKAFETVFFLSETYLVHFGTVFKRAWIVDIIHQTNHITREVRLRQEVKLWPHLMELVVCG